MRRSRLLPLSALLLLPGSLAVAQVGEPPTASEGVPNLSPRQQLETANEHLASMAKASETVRAALEQARANRDVVKVLCLNDKLNQIDIAARSAKGRVGALEDAVQQNDVPKARHDFGVLEVLQERVDALVAESNQCVGEEVGFVGESETKVTVDPDIPEPDVDQLGTDIGVVLTAPILSSPIL